MSSRDWADIQNIMVQRRSQDAHLIRRMVEIRDRYNGDMVVPMPDVVGAPDLPPLMPQLIYDGIENTALRASSTMPIIECPPHRRTVEATKAANVRRRALYGRWYQNQLTLKMRRAYRHMVGYGTLAMVVMPDHRKHCAKIELRDPLTAYPEVRTTDDIRCAENVGFVYGKSAEWIRETFRSARDLIDQNQEHQLWDMVEWVDEDEIVIGVLGPRDLILNPSGIDTAQYAMEIYREPNRAGITPAVVPRRITLDRLIGQMHGIVPIVDWQARLFALEVIAAEKSVFPDTVIFSDNQMPAIIADNEWKDGRTGDVNLISNARDVRMINTAPSQATDNVLDRLERAGRHAGGVSAQFSGEMTGSIRSGRVASSIAELSIDPRIQELQEIMSYALAEINTAVCEVEKGYFGNKKLCVYSGWAGDDGLVEYTPKAAFEHNESVVFYPMPGTDITQTNVALSQLVAGGMMSKTSSRRKHPFIDDAESEERRILVEQFEQAIIASAQQQIAGGGLPIIDAIAIRNKLAKGMDLGEAIIEADEEARARQAAEVQVPPEGMALPPEQMAGLATPGQGAEALAPAPPIAPPPEGVDNLAQMLNAIRSGASSPMPAGV